MAKCLFSSLPAHVQAIGPVLMWKICRTSNGCRDTLALRPDQRRQNNGIWGGSGNQTVQSFIRRATPCVAFVTAHRSCTGPGSELSGGFESSFCPGARLSFLRRHSCPRCYTYMYVILDVEVGSYQLPINCQSLNYQLMIRDEFKGVVLQSGVALTAVGLAMVQ